MVVDMNFALTEAYKETARTNGAPVFRASGRFDIGVFRQCPPVEADLPLVEHLVRTLWPASLASTGTILSTRPWSRTVSSAGRVATPRELLLMMLW